MRALITNDDGVHSPGLVELARAATGSGLEVLVAAPSWDASGASSSVTGVESDGRLTSIEQTLPGSDIDAFAVDASPAMITVAALRGGFGSSPSIVLSGINCGRNTGHAVLHSGTVGAALTGANHGVSGLAVSIDSDTPAHWDTARRVAQDVIEWLLTASAPTIVNLNVPDLPFEDLRGLRLAPLAEAGAIQTKFTDSGKGYLHVTFETPHAHEPGTDAALLAEGWAVVTPLQTLTEDTDVDTSGLLLDEGEP